MISSLLQVYASLSTVCKFWHYSPYLSIHILLFNEHTLYSFFSASLNSPSALNISYVNGPTIVPLLPLTVGQSLKTTVNKWPDREAVVFLQDGVRKTFSQFQHEVGFVNHLFLLLRRRVLASGWFPSTWTSYKNVVCNEIGHSSRDHLLGCNWHLKIHLQVDHLAAGLLALGLQKGDRLGIWGPNTYEWILFQFATAKAGIIMVNMWFVNVILFHCKIC